MLKSLRLGTVISAIFLGVVPAALSEAGAAHGAPQNRVPAGCTIEGTPGKDSLVGTDHRDVICGGVGNDKIEGLGGNDVLIGGPGKDHLLGDDGDDRIWGSRGKDRIQGSAGRDRMYGGYHADHLHGSSNRDVIFGGRSSDYINGASPSVRDRGRTRSSLRGARRMGARGSRSGSRWTQPC